jgi:hypothetical protein
MSGPRFPMRKIRDVLRLSAAGVSKRKIAASLGDVLNPANRDTGQIHLDQGLLDELSRRR